MNQRTQKHEQYRISGRIFSGLLIIFLLTQACNLSLPGGTIPTPTIPPTITPPAASPTPLPALPPSLIETDPPPQSSLSIKTPITFYFNQPMDKPSVETAFLPSQGVTGKVDWIDSATLRFTPNSSYAPGSEVRFSLAAEAKAANGKSLDEPLTISFRAADKFSVAERLPAPGSKNVDAAASVAVTFNQPVIAIGADAKDLPQAFTLTPAVKGRGEWLNTSTYIYYADPGLPGGQTFNVQLNPELTSTQGVPLTSEQAKAFAWNFSTAMPALLGVDVNRGKEKTILLNQKFTLSFNQPMDPGSVEKSLSLVNEKGTPAPGNFTWSENYTKLVFQPKELLQRSSSYRLSLAGTAQSAGGTALGQNQVSNYTTIGNFTITGFVPDLNAPVRINSGWTSITINLNAPLAKQDTSKLVTIDPSDVPGLVINGRENSSAIGVSGYFTPLGKYSIKVSGELRDIWGQSLGKDLQFPFQIAAETPSITIPSQSAGGSTLFVPSNETVLPIRITNIRQVNLVSAPISMEDFLRLSERSDQLRTFQPAKKTTWSQAMDAKPNQNEQAGLKLSANGAGIVPGTYFYQLSSPELKEPNNTLRMTNLLVMVSGLQVMIKTDPQNALAWVVSVDTNKPVEKANVQFLTSAGAALGTCSTDKSGLCQVALGKHNATDHIYAVVGKPGDKLFGMAASHWNQGIAGWSFNLPTGTDTPETKIYLYTDRPIYRPGDIINFKGIARREENGRFFPVDLKQVKARLSSPINDANLVVEMGSLTLPLTSFGTFSGSFVLPSSAVTGNYRLWLEESRYSDLYIQVADYRKPEIEVSVIFQSKEQVAGDLSAKITGTYYFGAPAGGTKVSWTLTGLARNFYLPENHRAGKLDLTWISRDFFFPSGKIHITEGSGVTGADGALTITIPANVIGERVDLESTLDLTLEATIEDESGFPVSGRQDITMHPASYYAGLRSENWTGQAGKEFGFSVLTGDWSGKPVGEKSLAARFSQVTWKDDQSGSPYDLPRPTPVYKQVGSTNFRTDGNGRARLMFTPPEPGNYQLDVTGEGIASQMLVWIGGPGGAPWPKLPNQQILLQANQSSFKPGETALIFVPNPFTEETPALVSVERGKIMRTSVISINGSSLELPLTLSDADSPNIFVSITLLGKRGDGKPDFRQGYIQLKVEPTTQLLKVDLKATPDRIQPGGTTQYTLKVTDSLGKPVKGEFSLAVIDKALLALADSQAREITRYFYDPRPLGVVNGMSLVVYAGRVMPTAVGRGGGGGEPEGDNSLRSEFKDTALWNPTLITGEDGTANVSLVTPDNLTTWYADLRGLTVDTRVGQATTEVVTSKDLLIRPVTPRFLISGDRVELAALVHNNTPNSLPVDVSLQAFGVNVEDASRVTQKVDVPAGDRRKVTWWVKVGAEKEADLVFSAKSNALQDAARPTQGKLPIRQFSSPQTFATGGMLTEGGERLEVVSLPRVYKPTGGELRVEMAPSLVASILPALKSLDNYPTDYTEPQLSRLLPNLMTYQLLKSAKVDSPDLRRSLESAINGSLNRLINTQNNDGGWGWGPGRESDAYITSYVVFGLWHAGKADIAVDARVLPKAITYLTTKAPQITSKSQPYEYDRAVFRLYVLTLLGSNKTSPNDLVAAQDRLSPWGKALLALTLQKLKAGDTNARNLVASLQATATRSATGASWSSTAFYQNFNTNATNTAAVLIALNEFTPSSPLLVEAVRFLVMSRRDQGGWSSSYESAWVILALLDVAVKSGDLKTGFNYTALLNGTQMANGKVAETPATAINPVSAVVPISVLNPTSPNALRIVRSAGEGRLYYRSYLVTDRPVEAAQPIQKGMSVSRAYYPANQDCRKNACKPLSEIQIGASNQVLARITLTVPTDMYYVVVEDKIPAGMEILNLSLKTSQQTQPGKDGTKPPVSPSYISFGEGWGWWHFGSSHIYDDRINWMAPYLPAGTYDLTYRLVPNLPGEYRVLPVRAWQNYFPEVEAAGAGSIFKIR